MKLVRIGARNTVVMLENGTQVLFERDDPVALRTSANVWYRVEYGVFREETDLFIHRFITRSNSKEVHAVDLPMLMYKVEQL